MLSLTSRFLSSVSTVSARNVWDHDLPHLPPPFLPNTLKKKENETLADYESRP